MATTPFEDLVEKYGTYLGNKYVMSGGGLGSNNSGGYGSNRPVVIFNNLYFENTSANTTVLIREYQSARPFEIVSVDSIPRVKKVQAIAPIVVPPVVVEEPSAPPAPEVTTLSDGTYGSVTPEVLIRCFNTNMIIDINTFFSAYIAKYNMREIFDSRWYTKELIHANGLSRRVSELGIEGTWYYCGTETNRIEPIVVAENGVSLSVEVPNVYANIDVPIPELATKSETLDAFSGSSNSAGNAFVFSLPLGYKPVEGFPSTTTYGPHNDPTDYPDSKWVDSVGLDVGATEDMLNNSTDNPTLIFLQELSNGNLELFKVKGFFNLKQPAALEIPYVA